jgi:hypothetical protein
LSDEEKCPRAVQPAGGVVNPNVSEVNMVDDSSKPPSEPPANDTIPAAPPSFSDFGRVEVAEGEPPLIPRGRALAAVLVATANVARAMGDLESVAAAVARALDSATEAADAT